MIRLNLKEKFDKLPFLITLFTRTFEKGINIMKQTPNAAEAREIIKNTPKLHFNRYSPAFIMSNEDIRKDLKLYKPKKFDNVLTVAASGDQPLFCKVFGAKKVTTFDISYNAKVITDIKYAALHTMTNGEYWKFLGDLQDENYKSRVPNWYRVAPKLDTEVQNYVHDLDDVQLFSNGYICSYKRAFESGEYANLQKNLDKPFPFIWANITELGGELTESYDFVHLSNALDYVAEPDMEPSLIAIMKHTNVGGRVFVRSKNNPWVKPSCEMVVQAHSAQWDLLENGKAYILQRTR